MSTFKKYNFDATPEENNENLPRFLPGYFLVSETELNDPNFYRTVVLLLSHNEEGALGLVVNRPSNSTLRELVAELDTTPYSEQTVYVGGPVEQNYLFTLHSGVPYEYKSETAIEPISGVVFEPNFYKLQDYLLNTETDEDLPKDDNELQVRFYAGYAGWAPGQLENELNRKDWVVIRATPDLVFSKDPIEAWRNALQKKGGIYWVAAETGSKPSLN